MKSGISDYSEVLVYGLRDFYDVTLYIDDYRLGSRKLYRDFEVRYQGETDRINFNDFAHRIYNIGNNPEFHSFIYQAALTQPGLIILHDVILYYLIVGFYRNRGALYSKLYSISSAKGINFLKHYIKKGKDLLECKNLAGYFPLNSELINSGNKIMVHSNYAYNKVASLLKDPSLLRKINHVQLVTENLKTLSRRSLFDKYKIPWEAILISSFGSIDSTKLKDVVCQTVNRINVEPGHDVYYLMVGEGNYADEYLERNIIKTGYVDH